MGRWMGVELRVHAFFPLLAVVCMMLSAADGVARGLGLFLVLTAAVLTRETARLMVAAWLGLNLRAILLLPIGGLYAYANPESQEHANSGAGQFALTFAGPVANAATALALAATFLGSSADFKLFIPPFISSAWLMRSMVWMQVGLALLHLLPAYPLDCGRLIRGSFARKHGFAPGGRAATGLGQALALGAMVGGMVLHSYWLIIAGFFIMIGAQIEDQGVFFQSVVDTVRMREVMLTDFATLSPSDTLADALVRLRPLAARRLPRSARAATGGHRQPSAHSGRTAQRRQRIRAGGDVAGLSGGEAGRYLGDHHSPHHRRARTGSHSGYRERTRRRHCERTEPDEFDVPAGRTAPPGTRRGPNRGSLRSPLVCPEPAVSNATESESRLAPGLYLVATPIGNLGDITLRALDVLKQVDRIACEDTRQTQKLLNHFAISTPTISCHQHNERQRAEELIRQLKAGGRIALVSDAGMPGISDPGGWLTAEAIAAGIPIIPIPGANAALCALVASGLPAGEFHFIGFLPEKAGARRTRLESLAAEAASQTTVRTLVFYEAPHRILDTLADMEAVWGPELRVVVARELTKIHEKFLRSTVAEARRELAVRERIRGEITLLVEALPRSGALSASAASEKAFRPGYAPPSRGRRR